MFNSFFNNLPFDGTRDENGMPLFPLGGGRGGWQEQGTVQPTSLQQGGGYGGGSAGGTQYGPTNDGTFAGWDGNPGSTGNRVGDPVFAAQGLNNGYAAPMGGGPSYSAPQSGHTIFDNPGAPSFDQMNQWMQPASFNPAAQTQFNFKDYSTPNDSTWSGTPHFGAGNIAQAGVNMASNAFPGLGALAGILQGFNLFGQAPGTGNTFTDAAGTAGPLQSVAANAANWLNRQFGGTYMPDSYIAPTLSGPSQPGAPDWNAAVQAARDGPPQGVSPAQLVTQAAGFVPSYGTDFDSLGNMLDTFMQGAGFDSRWGGDGGGGFGFGGGDSGDGGWSGGTRGQKIGTGDSQ